MTSGRHVPELVLSNNAENALLEYGILTWATLFSILFDPEVDGVYKRRHASDMILFEDEGLCVAYRHMANGDLQIGFVETEADIDRL